MPRRAGFWIRLLAMVIDVIPFLMIAAAAVAVELAWDRTGGAKADRIGHVVLWGGWLLYASSEVWAAGTPGKLILGLRINAIDGTPADPWRRVLRWSTKQSLAICLLLFALTAYGVFYLLAGFMNLLVIIGCLYALNDDRLTWHDQWAGTAVCHKEGRIQAADHHDPATMNAR